MVVAMLLFFPPVEPNSNPSDFQSNFTLMMLVSVPGYLIFYAWVLAVGVACNQSLEVSARRSERLFRFSVPFAMIYLTIATWAFPEAVLNVERGVLRLVVVPLHLIATFCLFYSVVFSARSLAMLDNSVSPGSWRTLGYFMALLYYPIGLWFIQPRVNAISATSRNGR